VLLSLNDVDALINCMRMHDHSEMKVLQTTFISKIPFASMEAKEEPIEYAIPEHDYRN